MSVLDALSAPRAWRSVPFGKVATRTKESGRPELPPLSVFLGAGVVPRDSREDNHNQLGEDLGKYLVVRPGDLVFNKLRTWQGGLGASQYEGIVSPAYFVCRPTPDYDSRFLQYLLLSDVYLQELTRVSKWQPPSQFDIGWEQLRAVPIISPAVSSQRAIADYLDGETARIDALINKKQRMIDLLEARFESFVFTAVTKGLVEGVPMRSVRQRWVKEIPEHWGMPTVSTNFELQLGKMLNGESADGPNQFPYLRNVNVQWDRFDFDDLGTMHFSVADRSHFELMPGDVLVCEGGEVGRAAVWVNEKSDCYFQKAIHRVRPRSGRNSRYLMYCLRAAAKQSVFSVEGNTSTIVHLTGEQLAVHRFPWPPASEQAVIVERLDSEATRLNRTREAIQRQIDLLREHRQALITAAVTGEFEVPGVAT